MTGEGPQRIGSYLRSAEGSISAPRVFAVLIVVVIGLGGIGVAISLTAPEITQPLVFSHFLHLDEVGLECTDCHLYVTSGERTIIPNIQGCADCHFEAITESEDEARLVEHIESEELIPWRQVYWVPDHVYFSHRRHTAAGEIECETCHGPVSERVEPLTRALVPITMNGCMDCHDRSGASNDCIVCHR
jgi:hypothetical protein